MTTYQSRWGYHPIDYSTFRKLKTLHKYYWETVYAVARWIRWDRKTVHRFGPEPEYCPLFVEEKGHWQTFTNRDGYQGTRWVPKTLVDHGILESYQLGRMPAESPEKVPEIPLTREEIDRLYRELEAWLAKKGTPLPEWRHPQSSEK